MPLYSQLLVFALLLLAIAAGWWLGYRTARRKHKSHNYQAGLSRDYLRGLSLLLNEESDKALDVFLKLFDVDQQTIETHFALGSLYRRRGETERALKIHQNLIARADLAAEYREQALYELAEDYLKAGVLDRAEHVYLQLLEHDGKYVAAMRRLLRIYEQQKEWLQAIDIATRIEKTSGQRLADQRGHYYCELADQALSSGDTRAAERHLRKALATAPDNIRANLLMAQWAEAMDNPRLASHHYQRVIDLDMRFAVEVFTALERSFQAFNDQKGYKQYLQNLARRDDSAVPRILLAMHMYRNADVETALNYVSEYLQRDATLIGVAHILKFMIELIALRQQNKTSSDISGDMNGDTSHAEGLPVYMQLQASLERILDDMHRYSCQQCGFTSRNLAWRCPSCNQWSTTVPVRDGMMVPSSS